VLGRRLLRERRGTKNEEELRLPQSTDPRKGGMSAVRKAVGNTLEKVGSFGLGKICEGKGIVFCLDGF